MLYLSDGQLLTTLCPILGETHAQIFYEPCPRHAQSPRGKELKISFIGPEPFITYNPIGGSDFLIVKLLAKKFGFIPQFVPEKSMDAVKSNGTSYGMVYKVGGAYFGYLAFIFCPSGIQVSMKQSEIGIGQLYIVPYNYKLVDYLHIMYEHPYFMCSRKAQQIASFDTILYSFDFYVWGCTFSIIFAQFFLLIITQNLWSYATKKPNPRDYIYQGLFDINTAEDIY